MRICGILFGISLILGATTIHYDYHLNQGKKMWKGTHHALHFFDHFKFLNTNVKARFGAMQSAYQFHVEKEFNIAMTLVKRGEMKDEQDGFALLLTKEPLKDSDFLSLQRENNDQYMPFQDMTKDIKNSGLYILFTGGMDRSLYGGYGEPRVNITKDFNKHCDFRAGPVSHFLIKLVGNQIFLLLQREESEEFYNCVSFEVDKWVQSFYITILARASQRSSFELEVQDLKFSTDHENLGIAFFHDKHASNHQRIFQQIHFYKQNRNAIEKEYHTVNDKHLNLTHIAKFQEMIHKKMDYVNHFLGNNLDSTDEIVAFIEQQNEILLKFTGEVITSIQNLINTTVANFEEIEKESNFMINEYQDFNLEGEFLNAKAAIDSLNQKIRVSVDKLRIFKNYPDLIKSNLKFLMTKEGDLKRLPHDVEEYIEILQKNHLKDSEYRLLIVMISAAILVIATLLAILWRVTLKKKLN